MSEYKVITKRNYLHSQNNKLLSVREYIIIEKDNKRYLMLKLFNNSSQTLRRFDFAIVQKSLDGDYIATNEYKQNDCECAPQSEFVPDLSLEVSKNCEDVFVELKNAVFDNFLYDGGKKYTISSIEGKKVETSENTVTKKSVGKLPKLITVAFVILSILVLLFSFFGVKEYRKNRYRFNINDFLYEFVDKENKDDTPIIIKNYHGADRNVLIPAYVKGHKVLSIEDDAFAGNQNLENVKIEGNIVIKKGAFFNCSNLQEVNLENVTYIGDSAFQGSSINNAKINSATYIGDKAFYSCRNLKSVEINNKKEEVNLGKEAFQYCYNLKDLTLKNKIKAGDNLFKECYSIENVDLDEYSVISKECKNLGEVFMNQSGYGSINTLKTLHIKHIDHIPEAFVANNSMLEKADIEVINKYEIPKDAFKETQSLVDLLLPRGITKVSANAFFNSGIKEFDGNALETIEDSAFMNCKNLGDIHISDKLTVLQKDAFNGCESLKTIYIPSKILEIPERLLNGCKNLTTIDIPSNSSISDIKEQAFKDCSSVMTINIPSTLQTLGNEVFCGCKNLSKVTIPETINIIPESSFSGCESLQNLDGILYDTTIDISRYAFSGCKGLTNVAIPESITFLNDYVFEDCSGIVSVKFKGNNCVQLLNEVFKNCTSLSNIVLPESLIYIGTSAFEGCTNLPSIKIPAATKTISNMAFKNCDRFQKVELNNDINILDYAYQDCDNLTSFVINAQNISLNNAILAGCNNLREVNIPIVGSSATNSQKMFTQLFDQYGYGENVPSSLKKVTITQQNDFTSRCFANCSNIEEINIPQATYLGDEIFANCSSLKSFNFPSNLTYVGQHAFSDCTGLTEIHIKNAINYGIQIFIRCNNIQNLDIAYSGSLNSLIGLFDGESLPDLLKEVTVTNAISINGSLFSGCNKLEKVNIPDTEVIEGNAFSYLSNLKEINVTNKLVSIGYYAFDNCKNLTNIKLPSSLRTISYYAFHECDSLISVLIPDGVTSIENDVFFGCDKLEKVVLPSTLTSIGNDVFYNCNNLYEVINKSGVGLDQSGADKYAISITSSENNAAETFVQGNCKFAKVNGDWYLACYYADENNKNLVLPNVVQYKSSYIVYNIKKNLFKEKHLENKLEVPSNVKSIGDQAFAYCNFDEVIVNNGVREIGREAFIWDSALKTIVIPNTLTKIDDNAFYGCSLLLEVYNLSNLNVEVGSDSYGGIAKEAITVNKDINDVHIKEVEVDRFKFNCTDRVCVLMGYNQYDENGYEVYFPEVLSLPESVNCYNVNHTKYSIRKNAFASLYSVTEINIPEGVTEIGDYAFSGLGQLKKVNISDNSKLTKIGTSAFSNDINLKEINIPDNVKHIGNSAFLYNESLRQITIPKGINSIADQTFIGCKNLKEIFNLSPLNIVKGSTDNGNVAYNALFVHNKKEEPKIYYYDGEKYDAWVVDGKCEITRIYSMGYENKLILPESIMINHQSYTSYTLKDMVFSGINCAELHIPKALEKINTNTFAESYIENIVFSDDSQIKQIPEKAFYNLNTLRTIKLPQTVNQIGEYAFYNCQNLTTHFELDKLQIIGKYAFYNCEAIKSFTLPKSIIKVQIGEQAFGGCKQLIYIENKSNIKLTKGSLDCGGIAYNAIYIGNNYDKEHEIHYFDSHNGRYRFVGINDQAFLIKATSINENILQLPKMVTYKDKTYKTYQLVEGCLKEIDKAKIMFIPKNVTYIENNVLPKNNSIREVYYEGTKEEWQNLAIMDTTIRVASVRFNSKFENGKWTFVDKNQDAKIEDKKQQQ